MRSTSWSRRALQVERLATGFTFTEGPIWHPTEHYLLFSDMPGDVRRKYTPDGKVVEVRNFSNKCNGMTYDADLNLLVCEHVTSCLVRESPDGSTRDHRPGVRGRGAQQPERRRRPLERRDLLLRPVVRAHARLRPSAQAAARLPGRLPDPAGRWRPRARGRARRVRHAERALLLARRVAHLHQRHAAGPHQGVGRGRRRLALQRPHVLRGHRLGRDRGGHPGRDEVRRAREHLGHGARRDLDHLSRRRAPRHDQGSREHGQPHLGRRRTGTPCTSRARRPCTRSAPSSDRGTSPTCARRWR